ncbi:MAG: carbamoyltransferase HypF [Bacteroidales bacterium]
MKARKITINGLVQGVGFRPFIYRLALKHDLSGWVTNNLHGVTLHVEGLNGSIQNFIADIQREAPLAATIESIEILETKTKHVSSFTIKSSESDVEGITWVSPDIAVCPDCIRDMKHQSHRLDYPFTNCTNCGPRFSITRDLPYDRENTTMSEFAMCADCAREYHDILDRRFHAQPVACNSCGPNYQLIEGGNLLNGIDAILERITMLIKEEKIIAVRGIGGYHLMCDAFSNRAVERLRQIKQREAKPFAVMFRDILSLQSYVSVDKNEQQILESWQRPVVILQSDKFPVQAVSNGFPTLGVLLPYMPFHYQLLAKLESPAIVLTSGNISDEPIIIDNKKAEKCFGSRVDAIVEHNRDINNRVDDSVAFSVNKKQRLIRRSRGFAPSPVLTSLNVEGILATGAELVNCFAIGRENQAILSQYIGDLKNYETYSFYTESIKRYKKLFRFQPSLVARDLHPDYLSSSYAAETGLPQVKIQHHHAHLASCMAEHGHYEKVIGVCFDGTGLGDDGHIWGGEFLVADLSGYSREAHFEYIPVPGGDVATKQPWRTGLSYLYHTFGKDIFHVDMNLLQKIDPGKINLIIQAIEKNINSPLSSSAGRLFDGIAAITGLCLNSGFHAEAPMRLEAAINPGIRGEYPFDFQKNVISFKSTTRAIMDDISRNEDIQNIATRFHNTIISVIFTVTKKIREIHGINTVVLSGGTFQNRYLLGKTEPLLEENGFRVLTHGTVPSNDGGIALGQLVIAAKKREELCV